MIHTIKGKEIGMNSEHEAKEIRPFYLWQTALAFGIPTLVMVISFLWAMPALQSIGLTPFESMIVSHIVPMALLLTASLVVTLQVDRYPLTWKALRQRFRYPHLTVKTILISMGLFAAIMVGYGLFNALSLLLIEQGSLPIPEGLMAFFDPRVPLTTAVLEDMINGRMLGNWGAVILYALLLVFNIVGEELWWRGYILPRQEKRHGRFTWVLHGLLWTLFHAFKWWDLLGLLPVCLAIAYVSQRTKNNWPALIAHFLFNGQALVALIIAAITTIG
jgi:membrane protease YdiL (CAAX protease family)